MADADLKNYIFYESIELEALEGEDLVEATGIYFVRAKSMQDALNLFEDEVTMDSDEVRSYRVAEMPTGKGFSKKLSINE